jgi:hypothetical protein
MANVKFFLKWLITDLNVVGGKLSLLLNHLKFPIDSRKYLLHLRKQCNNKFCEYGCSGAFVRFVFPFPF